MKNYNSNSDSFLVTFAGFNKFQQTASFFAPPFHPRSQKLSQRKMEQSPSARSEVKKVFGAKPRSPVSKQTIKDLESLLIQKKNSVAALNQEQDANDQDDINAYYVLPQKTAQLKRRIVELDIKKVYSKASNRQIKLPPVEQDSSIFNEMKSKIKASNNKIAGNDKFISTSRINDGQQSIMKSNSFRRNIKFNPLIKSKDNSPDQTQSSLKGFKPNGLQNKIFRQTQGIQRIAASPNVKCEPRALDFGIRFEDSQYWSQQQGQQCETSRLVQASIKNSRTNFSRQNSPKENQPPQKSFLQRKQQMAILNKLFQKNMS